MTTFECDEYRRFSSAQHSVLTKKLPNADSTTPAKLKAAMLAALKNSVFNAPPANRRQYRFR